MSVLGLHYQALSDGAATGLIIAVGAGGSFVLVVLVTVITMRRADRKTSQARQMATVGGGGAATDGQDAFPPQPYTPDDPRTHRPYSRPYQIPRQDTGHHSTNGHRPAESSDSGAPTLAPWPPKNDEDTAAG